MNNGVVLVATVFKKYYDSACLLADSIKQYHPNCKVTLFTEEEFVNPNSEIFDSVITDLPNTPDDERLSVKCRAKMWGMANTPYDVTLYLDCDMMVIDKEFSTVFDKIKDNDMLFTRITADREYAYHDRKFGGGEFTIHGGLCLYKKTAKSFMMDWYEKFKKQRLGYWWPNNVNHFPLKLQQWDQFSLWWMINKESDKYKYLKYDFFDEDDRWNAVWTLRPDLGHGVKPIIYHYNLHER